MEAFVLWHRTAPAAHDEDADTSAGLRWLRHVNARFVSTGATVLGPIGGTMAAIFSADELTTAVDIGLALLEELEKNPEFATSGRVAIGAGFGELDFIPTADGQRVDYVGGAVDRAQLLANRARPGELVLDSRARDAAASTYLFHRVVGTGEASIRGHSLDREEPRIADCRRHFVHLGRPPTPAPVTEAFAPMRDDATASGANTVIVRGPVGSGSRRAIAELEFTSRPSLVLRCLGVPGGLEPLGSLRTGLVRAFGAGAHRLSRLVTLEGTTVEVLGRIARGDVVGFDDAIHAVHALIRASSQSDTSKPWIVIDPAHEADESTLEIVGRLARIADLDLFTVVQVRPDTRVPAALLKAHRLREIEVPSLGPEDARQIVQKMLREPDGGEIARRVAATGAHTPLAIVECVRAWVASGDVVRRGRSFVFRVSPRGTADRTSYLDWVSERIALLDDDSARLLELLALAPVGWTQQELSPLAESDGFDAATVERCLTRLREDRFVLFAPSLEVDTTDLRDWLVGRMPAARRGELAGAVARLLAGQHGFGRASYGHYLAESDAGSEAAVTLLGVAEDAVVHGHSRACIRIAAAAVQAAPSPEARARAAAILRGATLREVGGFDLASDAARVSIDIRADAVESPARVVIDAIRARDFERVDRYIDLAIAEGAPLAAADRWRAMVAALRGDTAQASQALTRARERSGEGAATRCRTELMAALLEMHEGRTSAALRTLLETLACARESRDIAGEEASLRAMSMCLAALGNADGAARLART